MLPEDRQDLERVGRAWGCTAPEAAWMMLRAQLARWRSMAPELGPLGLEAAASAEALGLGRVWTRRPPPMAGEGDQGGEG